MSDLRTSILDVSDINHNVIYKFLLEYKELIQVDSTEKVIMERVYNFLIKVLECKDTRVSITYLSLIMRDSSLNEYVFNMALYLFDNDYVKYSYFLSLIDNNSDPTVVALRRELLKRFKKDSNRSGYIEEFEA